MSRKNAIRHRYAKTGAKARHPHRASTPVANGGKLPTGPRRRRILLPEHAAFLAAAPSARSVLDDLDAVRGDR